MPDETAIGGLAREFPSTRWTLVLSSRNGTQARRGAMEELLSLYWKPLYFYARRKGRDPENAKDAVQGFFTQLLETDFLSRLDPERGSLRGYLKTSLGNHLINLHESEAALKRGGDVKTLPLDFDVAERHLSDAPSSADSAYDREWAVDLLERATARLRDEFESGERGGPFDLVMKFFQFDEAPSYADAAAAHGMSIPQLKAFLHRARTRYREILREEVAETVADPGEIDAEIGTLLRALRS